MDNDKREDGKTVHIRIPAAVYRKLRHACVERGMTNAEVVAEAIERCCPDARRDDQSEAAR
jgi:predicted DNA-binding protein